MEPETVESIVREAVAPINERFAAYIENEKESRRVLTALVTRLTTVVAGDKDFKQRGLVDAVEDHDKAIREIREQQADDRNQQSISKAEIKGAVRATLFIGGGIITIIQVVIQLYLRG